ncbi:MAG TPA: YfiR family protein [Paucimonas sp.]|nr:YfiR family protein [Paucimonas sp.]
MNIGTAHRFFSRSALALAVATGLPCEAQPAAAPMSALPEYKVKAAFVYNFALFTDWPQASLNDGAPLNVCVNAESALRPALNEFNDKAIKGRRMQIRAWTDAADAVRQCHVLVLDSVDRERWVHLRKDLAGASVLTVADDAEIGRRGAIVTLHLENNRISFDIDVNAAREARLTLSSKLLRLARTTP